MASASSPVFRPYIAPPPSPLGVGPRSRSRVTNRFSPFRYRATWFFLGVVLVEAYSHFFLKYRLLRAAGFFSSSTAPAEMAGLRPQFVLFGDSITQHSFEDGGWGASLQSEYARKVDVVLRGYSGYNTKWAALILDKVFPKAQAGGPPAPALVTVFFGANDAALPERSSAKQHVPVPDYKANLLSIVRHIQANSAATRIVLITPPPVDTVGRAAYARAVYGDAAVGEPERTNEVTGQYAQACREVAADAGVPVVDIWSVMQSKPDWERLLSDGLHFNVGGNQVLYEEVLDAIRDSGWFPSLVQSDMPWDLPEHGAIDEKDPEKSFSLFHEPRRGLLP
eukprot:jgi/Mesen1/10239/ME000774S09574